MDRREQFVSRIAAGDTEKNRPAGLPGSPIPSRHALG